jgi:hypothetical protein
VESAHPEPLACPVCARRYPLEERFCRHCGMPLVYAGGRGVEEPRDEAHDRARKIRPELTRGELVRVGFARHQAEAELMQNLLIEEGIPSVVRRTAGFDVPDFLAAGPRDVLVPESGVELARITLRRADVEPVAAQFPQPTSGAQVARIVVAIVAGATVAALIAWGLLQATT